MPAYLAINIAAIILPLLLSFDRKVAFYRKWKYLFPAMLVSLAVFIPWDVIFTLRGIWGFNPVHLTGLTMIHLPVEEWMFFIAIPYASIFTFEVIKVYYTGKISRHMTATASILLIILLSGIILFHYDRLYTLITCSFSLALILLHQFVLKSWYLGKFYLAFIFILLPFLVVNGMLTGTSIEQQVVWYNNAENLSVRILTIPVEDISYGFNLVLLNAGFYEYLAGRVKG